MFNEQFYQPKVKEKLFKNDQSNYFEHCLFYLLDEEGLSGEEVRRVVELILRSESKPIILMLLWYELSIQHFPNLQMILLYDWKSLLSNGIEVIIIELSENITELD
jgi:hypothetical protein